jgi:histidinol dehydrogenase
MTLKYLKTAPLKTIPTSQASSNVPSIVKGVIDDIRSKGDSAIRQYSEKFDKWSPQSFKLSEADIQAAISKVPTQAIEDIKTVQNNVRKFALAQRESLKDFELETQPGVFLGQKNVPVGRVGA